MLKTSMPAWLDDALCCVRCGEAGLDRAPDHYHCRSCEAKYPTINNAVMLLDPSMMIDAAEVIAAQFGGLDPVDVERVLGTALRYRLNDVGLRDEFGNIVERYETCFPPASQEIIDIGSAPVVIVAEYFNPVFSSAERCYRSFRIRNNSRKTLATEGPTPFNLSYRLTGPSGQEIEGVRSPFPVPLKPGHELTIPVLIHAPVETGTYSIEVLVVQEFVGWLTEAPVYVGSLTVTDTVSTSQGLVTPPHEGHFDFGVDIQRCGEFLERAVEMVRAEAGASTVSILEVACGADPMSLRHYQPGSRVVACDLAFPQVQLAALAASRKSRIDPETYVFAAADVFKLPFHRQSFDIVLVSAALHHFPDTVAALNAMKAMLKPLGKLLILREPGKVAASDPTYIRELLNGFNEQQFELAEYVTMFDRANLKIICHQLDFECSYKAIAEHSEPDPKGQAIEGEA